MSKPSIRFEDLVAGVNDVARSQEEMAAVLVHLINGGSVRLAGELRGAKFDLSTADAPELG